MMKNNETAHSSLVYFEEQATSAPADLYCLIPERICQTKKTSKISFTDPRCSAEARPRQTVFPDLILSCGSPEKFNLIKEIC